MKNYQHLSVKLLKDERDTLICNIRSWENTLKGTSSILIKKYLEYAIRQANEKIHAIDAELFYRENH